MAACTPFHPREARQPHGRPPLHSIRACRAPASPCGSMPASRRCTQRASRPCGPASAPRGGRRCNRGKGGWGLGCQNALAQATGTKVKERQRGKSVGQGAPFERLIAFGVLALVAARLDAAVLVPLRTAGTREHKEGEDVASFDQIIGPGAAESETLAARRPRARPAPRSAGPGTHHSAWCQCPCAAAGRTT